MIEKKLYNFIRNQEFVTLSTVNYNGSPHVSPKLFLKMEKEYIYLLDYLVGTTFENLKENNKVSISTFDIQDVKGFHIYGKASILESGPRYDKLMTEWNERQLKMATEKVSQAVRGTQNIRSLKLAY